jgi:predicted HicB family RNase H-like nuclease
MMNNQMTINGHIAVISFDPEVGLFRGEFVGLNGGADFYADSVEGLHKEGEASLKTFLAVCQEQGLEPYKHFSGKFITRVPASLHERIATAATAAGMSLNQWVQTALEHEVAHG